VTYIHNLTTVLADTVSNPPGSLSYSIPNEPATVHDLLLQKSNGNFYLIVWDERVPGTVSDNVTVNFGSAQPTVLVFDPTIGTTATQPYSNVSSIPFTLSDHPQILQISAPPPPPPVAANETATTSENTPVVVNLGTGATWVRPRRLS
jgi:hypothetical protein